MNQTIVGESEFELDDDTMPDIPILIGRLDTTEENPSKTHDDFQEFTCL